MQDQVETFEALEARDPRLLRLHEYWREKCAGRQFPDRADLDPVDFPYILGYVTLVDVIDVDLPDDVTRQGLSQPAFYMARDLASMRLEGWPAGIGQRTYETNALAFERNRGPAWRLLVTSAFHTDFSDQPLLCARPVCRWLGLSGPIGEGRTAAIAEAYEAAFFDRWLKAAPAPLLDRPSPFQFLYKTGILTKSFAEHKINSSQQAGKTE